MFDLATEATADKEDTFKKAHNLPFKAFFNEIE